MFRVFNGVMGRRRKKQRPGLVDILPETNNLSRPSNVRRLDPITARKTLNRWVKLYALDSKQISDRTIAEATGLRLATGRIGDGVRRFKNTRNDIVLVADQEGLWLLMPVPHVETALDELLEVLAVNGQ